MDSVLNLSDWMIRLSKSVSQSFWWNHDNLLSHFHLFDAFLEKLLNVGHQVSFWGLYLVRLLFNRDDFILYYVQNWFWRLQSFRKLFQTFHQFVYLLLSLVKYLQVLPNYISSRFQLAGELSEPHGQFLLTCHFLFLFFLVQYVLWHIVCNVLNVVLGQYKTDHLFNHSFWLCS